MLMRERQTASSLCTAHAEEVNGMHVDTVFVSVNADDFGAQSRWWSLLLDRSWDQEPRPSCHEWKLSDSVLFQVLDNPPGPRTTVTLRVADLDVELARLRAQGVSVADPSKVESFQTLRYVQFVDPEGNTVGLLDGR
ncbi:VOC family protein [Erythrobacter sp. NE805]|uniref:VOC family protein n=1 Tax=Erythrobacter sp. NE805 TaxID=3389875 RepID=UPI00396B1325